MASVPPISLPRLRQRLSPGSRLYAGFMAACTGFIFLLLAIILPRAWSELQGQPFALLLAATAVVSPVMAWFFGRATLTGLSPFPVQPSLGPTGRLLWAAVLGDPRAAAELHGLREQLRAHVTSGIEADPERAANVRGVYSVTLTEAARILRALTPATVEPVEGGVDVKAAILQRLEAEILLWRADWDWLETLVDRPSA